MSRKKKYVTKGDPKCLNFFKGKCQALKKLDCSETCWARKTNVSEHLEMLQNIIYYNGLTNNHDTVWAAQAELSELCERYNIPTEGRGHPMDGWRQVYYEDQKRGKGGGSSEGNVHRNTKQLMKDNRILETKNNSAERQAYKEAVQQWEEEHGKLEKLGRSSMSRSKVDSYTGDPTE